MVHRHIRLLPINIGFGSGFNSLGTFEQSVYNASSTRKVFMRDPLESWWKMKRAGASDPPYVEASFFGLKNGDHMIFKFDAASPNTPADVLVQWGDISEDYGVGPWRETRFPIDSAFRHYSVPVRITGLQSSSLGVIINIRADGDDVVIKNLEVDIVTSNERFNPVNQIVRYNNVGDYLRYINTISGMSVNPDFREIRELYDLGAIVFPDNSTLRVTGSNAGRFKGLSALFSGSPYRNPVVAYFEYMYPSGNNMFSSYYRAYDYHDMVIYDSGASFVDIARDWTRLGIWRQGFEGSHKIAVDVGARLASYEFALRNVIFSVPRFDDYDKREPNRLDDLYPNLGRLLANIELGDDSGD